MGQGRTVYITKLPEYRPLRHVLKQGFINGLQQCRGLLINSRPFAFARPGDVQRFNVVRACQQRTRRHYRRNRRTSAGEKTITHRKINALSTNKGYIVGRYYKRFLRSNSSSRR